MTAMDTKRVLDAAEALSAQLRELFSQKSMAEAEIMDYDRQLNDITHRMEHPGCKYRERSRLATRMANIRRDRRALKDWLKANQPYFEYIGGGDGERIQKMLGNLTGVGRRVEKTKAARNQEK